MIYHPDLALKGGILYYKQLTTRGDQIMAHLTDYELAVRKGARKIKRLESKLDAQKVLLEQQQAIEALALEVVIKPLEAALSEAQARVAVHTKALAESDDRMAELKAKLAASKAKSKGIK